jgi:pimeloyl-ACP methyl ester carboxylesterase
MRRCPPYDDSEESSDGGATMSTSCQANGIRIAFQDTGRGEPIVLVHGSWSSRHAWDAVVPALAEDHRVISYDRRGHSESQGRNGQGTFAEDVADLAALVEALDAVPAWVVGSSVGAVIALQLAATRRELVRGLIVHEPPLRSLLPLDGAGGPLRTVLELIRAGDHAAAAERFVEDVAVGPGTWAELPAPMRSTMTRNAATFLDEELAPDSREVDEEALARYFGPVLVSSGGRSPRIFQPVAPHLTRLLPQAHRVEYADAGHVPQMTHPQAFVSEVRGFIARPAVAGARR